MAGSDVMRRFSAAAIGVLLSLVGVAAAGCSSSPSSSSSTTSTIVVLRTAFCYANDSLDRASTNVTSPNDFLSVLKANPNLLKTMSDHLPPGSVGQQARKVLQAAHQAITSGNADVLDTPALNAAGPSLDTYCGVDGNGDPLPHFFDAGKGSAFCNAANAINNGTGAATSAAGVYSFLAAHQNLINEFASHVASLPSSVRTDAQTLVNTARTAISTNNPSLLGSATVSRADMRVSLYCGEND